MLCKKCNNRGTLILRKVFIYCDVCFIENIVHKFRACIGKNTKLTREDKALICLSGDTSSTILLDLVMNGISLDTHKKLRIIPVFFHLNVSKDDNVCNLIENQCKMYNVDLKSINISSMASDNNIFTKADSTVKSNLIIANINNYGKSMSPSAEKDFLSKMKQNIFYKIAREFECNLIFTSETHTKLSAKLLSNVVMGRGSQIENDIGFSDVRVNDVKLLRPMRDITEEELNHYIRIKDMSPSVPKTEPVNTLQSLITNFISDLGLNSPATISTICKTADKISSPHDLNSDKTCQMCQDKLKSKPDKLTSCEATAFSKIVSSGTYKSSFPDLESTVKTQVFPHIFEELCYSCSKNYYEFKTNIAMQ